MVTDPGWAMENEAHEAITRQILVPWRIGKVRGDLLFSGSLTDCGVIRLAELASRRGWRKRVWSVDCTRLPGSGDEEQRCRWREFFQSIESFSNVRVLADGFRDLGSRVSRLACAIIHETEANCPEDDALLCVWQRLAPGGAIVARRRLDPPEQDHSLLRNFLELGSNEVEAYGTSDDGAFDWVIKAGGPPGTSEEPASRRISRVVVASYGEDLRWTRMLWFPYVIYDATGRACLEGAVPVGNRAREAGQYLHHIVSNYPDFHDWEIFLQGSPFDHLAAPMTDLLGSTDSWHDFQPLGHLVPFDEHVWCHDEWAGRFAREWFGELPPDLLWVPGAQFAVRREILLSKPLDYWERLQRKVLEEETSPWAIERLWRAIFLAS